MSTVHGKEITVRILLVCAILLCEILTIIILYAIHSVAPEASLCPIFKLAQYEKL